MAGLLTAQRGAAGRAPEQCKLFLCLDWSLPSPSQMRQLSGGEGEEWVTRIGLQDDMTFIGSAAAMNRSCNNIEGSKADASHRLRGYTCGVWASGFEQYENQELPTEVRDQCLEVPRKRLGVSLLGSAAKMLCCMSVGLGQPAEPPTQTTERVEKAVATLQSVERFACDQHDHVSFAKPWMLTGKGVAHASDYDFRLVPPVVMAPLQRRLEGGLRQTLTALLGNEVSELAWERAELATCFGGLGISVAQMGFAAQATYWSAVHLHKAVMTSICEALGRPLRGAHPEETTALAAKADLLTAGVAVDDHAKVVVEHEARKLYEASPWAVDKRAAEIVRPAPVQAADGVPPKSLARSMASAMLQSRILSAAQLVQAVKLLSEMPPERQVRGGLALARVGRPCTNHRQNWHRMRNGGWQRRDTRCRPALHVCSAERQ